MLDDGEWALVFRTKALEKEITRMNDLVGFMRERHAMELRELRKMVIEEVIVALENICIPNSSHIEAIRALATKEET